jgi:hypothetical protein
VIYLERDLASAMTLAAVLARTALVAGCTATDCLALVLARTLVVGGFGGATTLAPAIVLALATMTAASVLAATLTLALVQALADVFGRLGLSLARSTATHRSRKQTRNRRCNQRRHFPSLHGIT